MRPERQSSQTRTRAADTAALDLDVDIMVAKHLWLDGLLLEIFPLLDVVDDEGLKLLG